MQNSVCLSCPWFTINIQIPNPTPARPPCFIDRNSVSSRVLKLKETLHYSAVGICNNNLPLRLHLSIWNCSGWLFSFSKYDCGVSAASAPVRSRSRCWNAIVPKRREVIIKRGVGMIRVFYSLHSLVRLYFLSAQERQQGLSPPSCNSNVVSSEG